MFERMTDRARRSIVLAQEEARLFRHDHIGTEHLLLGLIHEGDGVAARALERLDISLAAVRPEVDVLVGQGQLTAAGHIPFTPRAKKILEHSLREALELQHDYIGPEHILLGLTREREGAAAQILIKISGGLETVREAVLAVLASRPDADKGGTHGLTSDAIEDASDDRISQAAIEAAAAIMSLPASQRPEALFRAYRVVASDMENEPQRNEPQ